MTGTGSDWSIGVLLQARMGSQRLPGKVLRDIAGRPMLEWCLLRLGESRLCGRVIVATSTDPRDEAIARYCEKSGVPCFRGSEDDVLSRFHEAARRHRVDPVIRITADCPLIEPRVLDDMIARFGAGGADFISNALERTFPHGFDVEIFSFAALDKAFHLATRPHEHEHVTPFLYQHPEHFRVAHHKHTVNLSHYRVVVDTEADLSAVTAILAEFTARGRGHLFSFEELVALLASRPDILEINRHVRQKQLGE